MNFKDYFNHSLANELRLLIKAVDPNFNDSAFIAAIPKELTNLGMKDRVRLFARSLYANIDGDYPRVIDVLLVSVRTSTGVPKITGFPIWVVSEIIETEGLDYPDISFNAIHQITSLFTGEFAIRPFLEKYPAETLDVLRQWTADPCKDVRRLVSEGLRPRLPWANRVDWLLTTPAPIFELLDELYLDTSEYVRRSVANCLNDISKDHPEKVLHCLSRWLSKQSDNEELNWICRHSLRTLTRRGDRNALTLLGYDSSPDINIEKFKLESESVYIGGEFSLSLEVSSEGESAAPLIVDIGVISPGKIQSKRRRRVLRWTKFSLKAFQKRTLVKRWKLMITDSRRWYPGAYELELIVNGNVLAETKMSVS